VSCPDWKTLAAHRLDPGVQDEPEGWGEALDHFDGGCKLCRCDALKADPTLVFRRLPPLEMTPAREASEVDAVRRAVAAMRTASRVEALERRSRAHRSGVWKRLAAAAVLTLAALSIPSDDRGHGSRPDFAFSPAERVVALPTALGEVSDLPTIEGVNRPDARVYHMDDGEGLSLTMIIDESLEI
jgi:hypothetical protein